MPDRRFAYRASKQRDAQVAHDVGMGLGAVISDMVSLNAPHAPVSPGAPVQFGCCCRWLGSTRETDRQLTPSTAALVRVGRSGRPHVLVVDDIEARDASTDGHCQRLASLSAALGARIGLGADYYSGVITGTLAGSR